MAEGDRAFTGKEHKALGQRNSMKEIDHSTLLAIRPLTYQGEQALPGRWSAFFKALRNLLVQVGIEAPDSSEDLLLVYYDEPFAALDALTRRKMQDELLQLWDDTHFTVLFVTHSIPEAVIVGNRILLLSPLPGQVKAELNSLPRGECDAGRLKALEDQIHQILFSDRVEEMKEA